MSLAQSVTYEDENLNRQEVYINPVAIIGSVRKEMKDLDVLAYQLTAKKLSTYDSVALFFKTLENPKTARGASRILSGWRGFKAEGWKMDVGKGGKLLLPDNILDNLEKFRIVVPY